MRTLTSARNSRGFSMVEVLVALIIIAVGLLGIAKLQALLLSDTGIARVRALIAIETSSLASSMHADRSYWSNASNWGNVPLTIAIDVANTASPVSASNAALQSAIVSAIANSGGSPAIAGGGAPASCESGGASAPCSSVNMAAYQVTQWEQAMANIVGNSTVQISCIASATALNAVTCTVTVTWNENTVNANTTEVTADQQSGNAFFTQSYQQVVNP